MIKQNDFIPKWQALSAAKNAIQPPGLQDWIADKGSFMQRLRQNGVAFPSVEVLSQQWGLPSADERALLTLPFRSHALIREVLIVSKAKQWMFARTVIPRQSLTGKQRQLARLKARSLGSVLFKEPTLMRSEYEVAVLHPSMIASPAVCMRSTPQISSGWARRSIFTLHNKSLLLTEIFLPDIEMLCKR